MAERVNLKSVGKQAPTGQSPAAPRVINQPGLQGQLPYGFAKPIRTDAERAALKKLNIDPDQLPQMSDEDAEMVRQITMKGKLPSGLKDLQVPVAQPIENLPQRKQKELLDSIAKARTQLPKAQPTFIPAGPGIAEAKAFAEAQIRAKETKQTVGDPADIPIEDDRIKLGTQTKTVESAVELDVIRANKEQTETAPADAPPERKQCQHCGWELAKPDDVEFTAEDKQFWVVAEGSGKRFTRHATLLGGKIIAKFRALTVQESELVIRQMYLDAEAGRIRTPQEYYKLGREYRLVLGLAALIRPDNPQELPTYDDGYDVDFTDPKATGLPELVRHIDATVIRTESMKKMLITAHEHFEIIISKLEIAAQAPDF